MCNLYSNTTTQQAMRQLFTGIRDVAGNLASGRVYPDQSGAIVRRNGAGLELAKARWGLP